MEGPLPGQPSGPPRERRGAAGGDGAGRPVGARGGAVVGRVRFEGGVRFGARRTGRQGSRRRLTLISPHTPFHHPYNRSLEYSHHEFRETGFSPILAGDLYCEEDGEDEEHCYLFDYDDEGNVIDEVRGSYIEI